MCAKQFSPSIERSRWDPKMEKELIKTWERDGVYRFDPSSQKPVYSIDTPPPYTSNKFHVASAAHYVQQDMIARYKSLRGYNVLFPFGLDRNGQPVEVIVEREYNVLAKELPREEFIRMCKDYLDKVEAELLSQAKALGMSATLESVYRTDSPEYRALTQSTFIDLWKKGLVYEAGKPVNFCPRCGTSLADADVWYEELPTDLIYVDFTVKETGEKITIATTRPELIMACSALIYNPDDVRYKHLRGKSALTPIFNKQVSVYEHPAADPSFGTGLVMICSYGDYSDVRLFRELRLQPIVVIDENGRMNEAAGKYSGLTVREAREKITQDLKAAGLVRRIEHIVHRTPVCWRCRSPIEIIYSQEFYLRQLDFLKDVERVSSEIKFFPPESRQLLKNWLNSITEDWPISRKRFYATEIPIWYCKKCRTPYLPPKGRYYRPWKEGPPAGARCEGCGSSEFEGEQRVFDTWMDSSISELYITGYGRDEELYRKAAPASLRPQGYDIVRTWLYYSILRAYLLTGGPAFKEVRISGMGLDEKGQAMHKSKGNIVYPNEVVEKYGADAFRFWAASEAKLGSNYRYSEDKVRAASLFVTKIWNLSRFISSFPVVYEVNKLEPLDAALLQKLDGVISKVEEGYEVLDTFEPSNLLKSFTWRTFADHYVEAVKSRAYMAECFSEEQAESAWYTLHLTMRYLLIMLHPIMPFVTDFLLRNLYGKSAREQGWVRKVGVSGVDPSLFEKFMDVNSSIWGYKKEKGLNLKSQILCEVYLPKELEPFGPDLVAMHKLAKPNFSDPPDGAKTVTRGLVKFSQ